jgi:hypothetical protein
MTTITISANEQRRQERLEISAHDTSLEDIENLVEMYEGRFRLWEGKELDDSYISLQIPNFLPSHNMSMAAFSPHMGYENLQPIARRAKRLGWNVEDCKKG